MVANVDIFLGWWPITCRFPFLVSMCWNMQEFQHMQYTHPTIHTIQQYCVGWFVYGKYWNHVQYVVHNLRQLWFTWVYVELDKEHTCTLCVGSNHSQSWAGYVAFPRLSCYKKQGLHPCFLVHHRTIASDALISSECMQKHLNSG